GEDPDQYQAGAGTDAAAGPPGTDRGCASRGRAGEGTRPNVRRARIVMPTAHCLLPFFFDFGWLLVSDLSAAARPICTMDGGGVPACGVVGSPRCAISCMARSIGMCATPVFSSTQPELLSFSSSP